MSRFVSICGWILWKICITKFPRQRAAYSLVAGSRSFFATSIISFGVTFFRISFDPIWMKVLRADVPCNIRNISSLLKTYWSNAGKTSIIFWYSALWWFFVFFRSVHKRSNTCYRIDESIMFCCLYSFPPCDDLSADKSTRFWGTRRLSLLSTLAVC